MLKYTKQNKYFWRKKLHEVILSNPLLKNFNIFRIGLSLFLLPTILLELIKEKKNQFLENNSNSFLIYGKLIIFNSGKIKVFIENLRFSIERRENIFDKNLVGIIRKHGIILSIGNYENIFDLVPII
nr:hypothetical protein 1634Bnrm1_p007 [Cryptomonas sp.]